MADERTDRELMIAVRDLADTRAFAQLVRRWEGRLGKYLMKLTGDIHIACDLRQETFLRVWQSRKTYKEQFAFATWVTRIATNLARTHAFRTHRYAECLGLKEFDRQILEGQIKSENSITLSEVLDTLPPDEKELLLMRFQLELTYSEIAVTTGHPVSTVKSRMRSLLMRLRSKLTSDGVINRSIFP